MRFVGKLVSQRARHIIVYRMCVLIGTQLLPSLGMCVAGERERKREREGGRVHVHIGDHKTNKISQRWRFVVT